MKERKININKIVVKRVAIVLGILFIVIFALTNAKKLIKDKQDEKISLIINNNNVTARLKYDIKIEDGIIYVSMDDVENFFDKYIYIHKMYY